MAKQRNDSLREKVKKLRKKEPRPSYWKIAKELDISPTLAAYYATDYLNVRLEKARKIRLEKQ
jgi:hypothetical protein